MEFLSIAILLVAPLLALYVTGLSTQSAAERATTRSLTPRTVWSTVVRGNQALAPSTPYNEYARKA